MSTSTSSSSTSTTTTSTTSTTSTSTTIGLVTIEDIRSKINFNLQDDSEILRPEERDLAIKHAVRIYSKDRPLEKIKVDSTANGSKYDFDLPYDWEIDFSAIMSSIEYPVSDDIQIPQFIDDNDWIIYKKTDTNHVLRFKTFRPSSGYDIRYHYTTPHTVTDTNCTIYENDFDAVCELATGFCYRALAAKYAQTQEPSIEADVIDYARKTDEYITLAKEAFEFYARHIGKGEEDIAKPGAMAVYDLDIQFPWVADYLTHPKAHR